MDRHSVTRTIETDRLAPCNQPSFIDEPIDLTHTCFMTLSILLIDSDQIRAKAQEEKPSESGFARVTRIQGDDLARAVEQARPDLIIVDMALPTVMPRKISGRCRLPVRW